MESSANIGGRLGMGVGAAGVLGTTVAGLGAGIGAAITGILSGGLGAGAGAIIGAQIGGTLGGVLGSIAIFSDEDDEVEVSMESKDIRNVVIKCIAIIWGLSHNGYGRERKLSENEIKKIEDTIQDFQSSYDSSDWSMIISGQVFEYCEDILNKLDASELG